MYKAKELIELSVNDLKAKYNELSKEIYKLNCELTTNRKLEKPHKLKAAKRDRARVLTVLSQKNKQ